MLLLRAYLAWVVILALLGGGASAWAESEDGSVEAAAGKTLVRVDFDGLEKTKPHVAQREIWSQVGQPLDPELVDADVARLNNIGVFGAVRASAQPDSAGAGVVLLIEVSELPWIIPSPALNYTEENGFSVGLAVSSVNLAGRGIKGGASFLAGGTTTYNLNANDPWIFGNHFSLGMRAWHKSRPNQLLDYYETTNLIQLNSGVYLGPIGRLKGSLGYYGLTSDKDNITLTPDNHDDIFGATLSYTRDTRDSWRLPHEGWRNELAFGYFGGDADTWSMQLDINGYIPVNERQTFAFGPLLTLQSGEVDEQIPQYFQYFLGGVNSIRGYKLLDLGPTLFGVNQLILNTEYRFIVKPLENLTLWKWTISYGIEVAAFADAGVAWSLPEEFSLRDTRAGGGLGARLLIPGVESVRFDFGIGSEGKVLFNFGIHSIFDTRRAKIR